MVKAPENTARLHLDFERLDIGLMLVDVPTLPAGAAGVVVSDTLPTGVTFVSATGGGVYSAVNNTVTWSVGALADGASTATFTVNATIPSTASGSAVNRARVAATTADPTSANDRDAVTTTIATAADLSVTKTGASPS